MAAKMIAIYAQDFDGNVLASAKFYHYQAGTTTLNNVYTDKSLTTPAANPVVCDQGGFAVVWADTALDDYKFELYDSGESTKYFTQDNITTADFVPFILINPFLSGDQTLTTTSTPQFAGMTLTDVLTMSGANIDLAGNRIILDADNDSYIDVSADDDVDIVIGGTTVQTWTGAGTQFTGTLAGNVTMSGQVTFSNTIDVSGISNKSTVRNQLGLAIGSDVQAHDADLDTIAALSNADGNFIVGGGSSWGVESGATARASMGVTIGTDVLAYDSNLQTFVDNISLPTSTPTTGQSIRATDNGGNTEWANLAGSGDVIQAGSNTFTGLLNDFTGSTSAKFADGALTIEDSDDSGRKIAFDLQDVTTGNTRTFRVPDENVTLVGTTTTQTLTNKTVNLSSNTLTGTLAEFNTALSDGSFASLTGSETLTGKTVDLANNTLTGTLAEFNTALSDGSFASLAGSETLTNKTINGATVGGTTDLSGATFSKASRNALKIYDTAVDDYTALKALTAGDYTIVQVADSVRGGLFAWRSGDQSANVTDDPGEGVWVPPDSDTSGASGAWQRIGSDGRPSVKWWGAKGDYLDGGTPTDDTAAFQNMYVWLYESGAHLVPYAPPGAYYVTDDLTAGVTSAGKTIAKHISDGDLDRNNPDIEQFFGLEGEYGQTYIVVDETYSSTDSNYIDQAVLRYESASRIAAGPIIRNIGFYADMPRAQRKKCPIAIKAVKVNRSGIEGIISSGDQNEWYNTVVHIDTINNSNCENWRIKGGYQPASVDLFVDGGRNFNVTDDGSANTGARLVDADTAGAFANPTGETDSFWNGKWLLLGQGASDDAEFVLAKTRASSAKVDDNTLDLDLSWVAPKNSTGINISFELPTCSTTAGSNSITFDEGVIDSDDEGRMIHVLGAGVDGQTERGILSAYIKPGSISGKTCSLVHSDGTTAANARLSKSNAVVIFNPPVYVGQSAEFSSGHNNDVSFEDIHVEKGRGGAQMLLEKMIGCHFGIGKCHGRDGGSESFEQQFTECGWLIVGDNLKNVTFDQFELSWFEGIDPNSEHVSGVAFFGDRNNVTFNNYQPSLGADTLRLFSLDNASGSDQFLRLGDALNNFSGWEASANDRDIVSLASGSYGPQNLDVAGKMKLRQTGGSTGPTDVYAPYKKLEFGGGQNVTISSGAIDATGTLIIVDTEGGASTDDLDTINGGVKGQVAILGIENFARDVTIKDGTGNIVLPDGDITLERTRERVILVYDADVDEWHLATPYVDSVVETANTFTPTMTIGGTEITAAGTPGSYATQTGVYVIHGDLVWIYIDLQLSAVGSATGAVQIEGLPAAIEPTGGLGVNWMGLNIGHWEGLTSMNGPPLASAFGSSVDAIRLRNPDASFASTSNIDDTNLTNSARFHIAGFYRKV